MANRMYRTLPAALRRGHHGHDQDAEDDDPDGTAAGTASEASSVPPRSHSRASTRGGGQEGGLFGINIGLSNLISGGISFLGNLRSKKTLSGSSSSTPIASNSSPTNTSSSSSAVENAKSQNAESSLWDRTTEQVELSSFPSLPEVDGQGEGHQFDTCGSFNPTWCDLCGELIWGLYDTGATKCVFCQFTCHVKCQKKVKLNCSILHSMSSSASSSIAGPVKSCGLILPCDKDSVTVNSSLAPNISSVPDNFVTAAEELDGSGGADGVNDLKNGDESTLHNISTLRSEVRNHLVQSKSLKKPLQPSNEPANKEDSDDDDDYKTLRDVANIQFDFDDVPVRKASLESDEGGEGDATLTREQIADCSTSRAAASSSSVTAEHPYNATLSRQFSLINYVALPLSHEDLLGEDLDDIVAEYNRVHFAGAQQETVVENGGERARGFIRVQLQLRRPINVISGQQPPPVYNISNSTLSERSTISGRSTLTSFYLPPDTVKCLHVDTDTTTRDVVRGLLAKFRVADSPHKYALYEKRSGGSQPGDKKTLSRIKMRKLSELERPLVLGLLWVKGGKSAEERSFVLQENDPGEITWESFSVPELKNFLLILDREEAWYKRRIHEKYEALHGYMRALAREKREADDTESSSVI